MKLFSLITLIHCRSYSRCILQALSRKPFFPLRRQELPPVALPPQEKIGFRPSRLSISIGAKESFPPIKSVTIQVSAVTTKQNTKKLPQRHDPDNYRDNRNKFTICKTLNVIPPTSSHKNIRLCAFVSLRQKIIGICSN